MLALALQADADGDAAARQRLDRIRYTDGDADFATRRHLIDAQWIPELERDGLLRDVTRRIGGRATRTASLRLSRATWAEQRAGAPISDSSGAPCRTAATTLDYLPWDGPRARRGPRGAARVGDPQLDREPDAERPDAGDPPGSAASRRRRRLVTRHASSSSRRVVEEPLDAFLAHSRARRKRSVLGVNVLAIAGKSVQVTDSEFVT